MPVRGGTTPEPGATGSWMPSKLAGGPGRLASVSVTVSPRCAWPISLSATLNVAGVRKPLLLLSDSVQMVASTSGGSLDLAKKATAVSPRRMPVCCGSASCQRYWNAGRSAGESARAAERKINSAEKLLSEQKHRDSPWPFILPASG